MYPRRPQPVRPFTIYNRVHQYVLVLKSLCACATTHKEVQYWYMILCGIWGWGSNWLRSKWVRSYFRCFTVGQSNSWFLFVFNITYLVLCRYGNTSDIVPSDNELDELYCKVFIYISVISLLQFCPHVWSL